jgi:hypothetical protein
MDKNLLKEWNEINKDFIFEHQEIDITFISEKWEKLNYNQKNSILRNQILDMEFIREKWEKLNYNQKNSILCNQILDMEFIRERWIELISLFDVFIFQKLSMDFIKEIWDILLGVVEKNLIIKYQKLDEDFIISHKIKIDEDSWAYVTEDFKKNKIKESNLFECFDDYFIAYKGIRRDRHSVHNFQYQYLKGEIYECHTADYTSCENSFGLSAWTYEGAKKYCSELVVKVKILYKDVARLTHSNKIRCFRLEVLD